MTIHAIASHHTTPYIASKTDATGEQVFTIPETVATTQKDSSTVYEKLSNKYDVRNATFEEVNEISLELYKAGKISLGEHAALTFDFGRATNDIKQSARRAGMPVLDDFSMYKTSANGQGQRDWIAEIQARASSHFNYGNLVGYQTNSKILAILQKLETKES